MFIKSIIKSTKFLYDFWITFCGDTVNYASEINPVIKYTRVAHSFSLKSFFWQTPVNEIINEYFYIIYTLKSVDCSLNKPQY